MWVCFLYSTTCMQVPFIVDEGIKWQMNTNICSQCPILFPCFFYKPYISLFNTIIFHSLVSNQCLQQMGFTSWLIIDHIEIHITHVQCLLLNEYFLGSQVIGLLLLSHCVQTLCPISLLPTHFVIYLESHELYTETEVGNCYIVLFELMVIKGTM